VELPPLPEGFVVASDAMRHVVAEAELVAGTDATVLITGESGTGKELVAELIHSRSQRGSAPLVRVNCAAMPQGTIESELFGHCKGAFTGAEETRLGRFEIVKDGTLILDEVGELPIEVQPKLLRVLEDGSFERVGESTTRRSAARVIACTNRDLEREVAEERFREDLFWRLNVFRIHMPPLRERLAEISALVRGILARSGRPKARFSPAALRVLESYSWPGNVRELANVIERASILAAGQVILPEHLPDKLRGGGPRRYAGQAAQPEEEASSPDEREADGERSSLTVREAERQAIREALRRTGGNRTQAAKLLGISRRTLLYRLKHYGGEP
jgi:transcriptional regulator with GAF, ATPase, and Fis domain